MSAKVIIRKISVLFNVAPEVNDNAYLKKVFRELRKDIQAYAPPPDDCGKAKGIILQIHDGVQVNSVIELETYSEDE